MKWFNNLKMIQKLLPASITLSLFIGIVGLIGFYSMQNIDKNVNNIYKNNCVGINSIDNLNANLLQIRGDIFLIIDPNKKMIYKKIKMILQA